MFCYLFLLQVGKINGDAFDCAFNEWYFLSYELSTIQGINFVTCPACENDQHTYHCDGNAKLVRLNTAGKGVSDILYD